MVGEARRGNRVQLAHFPKCVVALVMQCCRTSMGMAKTPRVILGHRKTIWTSTEISVERCWPRSVREDQGDAGRDELRSRVRWRRYKILHCRRWLLRFGAHAVGLDILGGFRGVESACPALAGVDGRLVFCNLLLGSR